MRRAIASWLHGMATRIYNADHRELIEVHDEYDICRCRLEVITDDYVHRVEAKLVALPAGWSFNDNITGGRSDKDRHQHRPDN